MHLLNTRVGIRNTGPATRKAKSSFDSPSPSPALKLQKTSNGRALARVDSSISSAGTLSDSSRDEPLATAVNESSNGKRKASART